MTIQNPVKITVHIVAPSSEWLPKIHWVQVDCHLAFTGNKVRLLHAKVHFREFPGKGRSIQDALHGLLVEVLKEYKGARGQDLRPRVAMTMDNIEYEEQG